MSIPLVPLWKPRNRTHQCPCSDLWRGVAGLSPCKATTSLGLQTGQTCTSYPLRLATRTGAPGIAYQSSAWKRQRLHISPQGSCNALEGNSGLLVVRLGDRRPCPNQRWFLTSARPVRLEAPARPDHDPAKVPALVVLKDLLHAVLSLSEIERIRMQIEPSTVEVVAEGQFEQRVTNKVKERQLQKKETSWTLDSSCNGCGMLGVM